MNKPDDAFVLCRKLENVTDKVLNDSNMSEPTSELLASPYSCLKVAIQSRLVDKIDKVVEGMVANEDLVPAVIGACLCLAALYGFDDCVDTLLKHGAPLNFKSVTGHTPLMKAVMSGNASTVELLLRSGADTSIHTDSGLNVVDIAIASNADEEIINMLNADFRGNLGS